MVTDLRVAGLKMVVVKEPLGVEGVETGVEAGEGVDPDLQGHLRHLKWPHLLLSRWVVQSVAM